MKVNSSTSTSSRPTFQPVSAPSLVTAAPLVITPSQASIDPAPGDSTVSWHELRTLVVPLAAVLITNSHEALLDAQVIYPFYDPHSRRREVRVCYRLNPRFFHEETSLDEILVALLRANRRGRTSRRWPLRITTELALNSERSMGKVWSALVISSPNEVEREDCVNHVNRLLRVVLRPGYIQPLTVKERAILGRVSARRHR